LQSLLLGSSTKLICTVLTVVYCQQGALHLVLGSGNKRTFAIRRNWETLLELWPAIAQAQRFEKPSILKIVDDIITKVCKSQETIAITVPVSLNFFF
jgi:hypothetical protein